MDTNFESAQTIRSIPLAYHITFSCYGRRLHGEVSGTVFRGEGNYHGNERIPYNPGLALKEQELMSQPPFELDWAKRKIVLEAIIETCNKRGWSLYAAHVRSTHVHVLVHALQTPERVMNDFKAFASKRLNEAGFDWKERRRWARHGSTQYKWTEDEVEGAANYILREQGPQMEIYDCTA